jgi:hypothetical protein
MAEEFSYRLKDVSTTSPGTNLVEVKICSKIILLMDEDLSLGVAKDINRTSLPYETDLDQDFCHNSIRHYVNNEGKPPPIHSYITGDLSYGWDKLPSTGHYSMYRRIFGRKHLVSWDITTTTPMYVLRQATDPEVEVHFYFSEFRAETKRPTSAQTLQAEKSIVLWSYGSRSTVRT